MKLARKDALEAKLLLREGIDPSVRHKQEIHTKFTNTFRNIAISDLEGNEVLKVIDNYIKVQDDDLVTFEQVPGCVRIMTNHVDKFLPERF